MRRPRPPCDGERGAAVLLFVGLVVAAAIAATASMMIGRPQFAVQQGTGTGFDLTALRKAVEAHAIVVNSNVVVCPDTNDPADGQANGAAGACNEADGVLPWRDIGVSQGKATDAWGKPVQLVAARRGLNSYRAGSATDCDFILVSGGDDRQIDSDLTANTIDVRDTVAGTDLDIAVCGSLGNSSSYNPSAHSLIVPAKITKTTDTSQHIAPRFKTPPHDDWSETDEVMYFGGASDEPATYDLTAGNVNRTACAWYNDTFHFTDETLRGFIRFQYLPGEALSAQTQGTSQGFALMVVPGERDIAEDADGVPSAACGVADSNNAYGFKGVARPKFALEFDIYRDSYEGMNDFSGGRNNPKPEGNHVALLNPLNNDHISHGGSGNPPCQIVPAGDSAPAMNGEKGGCTYPPANEADRPERHATRPAHWLEDGQYLDGTLMQNAAQPYVVRFELQRLCNADCSTCGEVGGTNVHAKAWVACDAEADDVTGTSGACPDFPIAFQNVTETYAGTTDYMVNHCMPDRSLNYAESFDTVKLGIGFSTRSSAVALIVHRFEAKSD